MEALYWIDTHCHINDEVYRADFDTYVARALQMRVFKSLVVCMNREDLLWTLDKKFQYEHLDVAFGYHPEDADKITERDLEYMKEAVKDDRIVAIGEIGLDYYWDKTHAEKQKELFIRQLEIANEIGKPVLIHSRSAVQDTYDILKKYAKTKVLMHCFGESYEMMQEYLKLGYYIAFGGVVTFKNARNVQYNAQMCPLDRIMLETDCPYMTPVPYRGRQNETAFVRYVGEYIAQLKGISEEELQRNIIRNYREFIKNGKNQ